MQQNSVCIIGGVGHIGLPLGLALADVGFDVTLLDQDEERVKTVLNGEMPFLEKGADTILKRLLNKNLKISTDKKTILESHYLIIVIGTPVDEHLNPEFNLFKKFFDDLLPYIQEDHHVILRSTLYPGTTEKIKDYLETKGKKIKISFCPERIAQGQALEEFQTLPQIISSFDDESSQEAAQLFSRLTKELVFLTPIEAELAKIFTNVFRYILFSISNQFYQIAASHGLDFYRIFEAITYKYPRTQNMPAAGFAAGPCLFKDTMQLAAFSDNNFFLGHAAMLINEGLPNFIIQALKQKINLSKKKVGILGMAFKGNNDDKRESLSYKLKKILEIEASEVFCTDVYIHEEGFLTPEQLIEKCDVIILGACHREYKILKIPPEKKLVDMWNFYKQGGAI